MRKLIVNVMLFIASFMIIIVSNVDVYAGAPNWIVVARSQVVTYYIDLNSIKRVGGSSITYKYYYDMRVGYGVKTWKTIEADCSNSRMRTIDYKMVLGNLEPTTTNTEVDWVYATQNSPEYDALYTACINAWR